MHLSFAGSLIYVGVCEADIDGLHLSAVNPADIELIIFILCSVLKLFGVIQRWLWSWITETSFTKLYFYLLCPETIRHIVRHCPFGNYYTSTINPVQMNSCFVDYVLINNCTSLSSRSLICFSVSSLQFFQDLAGKPSSHELVKGEFNSSRLYIWMLFVQIVIYNAQMMLLM